MHQTIMPAILDLRVQPAAVAPHIEVTPVILVVQPMVPAAAMTVRFFRLDPPRFLGATRENAHEFLIRCCERLYTLNLVESRGADYITYQLDGPARQWWHTFMECRLVGSPPLT